MKAGARGNSNLACMTNGGGLSLCTLSGTVRSAGRTLRTQYPEAIPGALRALQRGKFVLIGVKGANALDSGKFGLVRRCVASGEERQLLVARIAMGEP